MNNQTNLNSQIETGTDTNNNTCKYIYICTQAETNTYVIQRASEQNKN